jgi:hypothetical protein
MSALRIVEKKIVLCKKGDEITGLDGTPPVVIYRQMRERNSHKRALGGQPIK